MMKKVTLVLTILLFGGASLLAQTIKVEGMVVSAEDDSPIPGVTIWVKGSTEQGTTTDVDGKFTILVSPNTILVFSFVGMQTLELPASPQMKVALKTATETLSEVVVTALGLTREKKSLGYAVQDVKGDALTRGGQINVASALSGKVAGVQITSSGGQIGASQRIVIRGNSSLGDNQPLIIVDGIPIDNDQKDNHNVDFGSGLNDINPDDIESISVLKGGSAALYGMRAGNGVILITTKSGKNRPKGVSITYTGNVTFDRIYNLPRMQNKYGQGYLGDEYHYQLAKEDGFKGSYQDFAVGKYNKGYGFSFVDGTNGINDGLDESWGPRLDIGLQIPQVNSPVVNGVRQATPWVSHKDNVKDFFVTGFSMNHNVSLTQHSDKNTTRASLGYRKQQGTVPNTDQERYSAQLNTHMELHEQLQFDLVLNYTRTESDNLPMRGYEEGNPVQSLLQWFGRQVDMQDLKAKWQTKDENGVPYSWNPQYHQNPYYTVHRNTNAYKRNRIFGKTSLFYSPFRFLKIEGRLGYDYYDTQSNLNIEYNTAYPEGGFRQYSQQRSEVNADVIAYFNQSFGEFTVNALAGANYRNMRWEANTLGADKLTVPGIYTISNAKGTPVTAMDHSWIRSNSVYAQASVGFKSMAYIDASIRNDWSSTIADPFFYPAVSASWIPTATFPNLQSWVLSYLKLRGGWSKVGSATSAYRTGIYYQASDAPIYGINQFFKDRVYPPFSLKPESVQTSEFGLEAALFNHRLSLDISVYQKITTDQIMEVAVSKSTGYNSMLVNAGKIENKGIELQLSADIFKNKEGFNWTATLNWAKDRSKIKELYKDPSTQQELEQYQIGSEWSVRVYAKPGDSWGSIWGTGMQRDEKTGAVIISEKGLPKTVSNIMLGDVTPHWIGGFRNEFSIKNINFGFLLDFRKGGDMFSVTQMFATYTGLLDYTAQGDIRERPIVVGKDVLKGEKCITEDGKINTIPISAQEYYESYYANRELSVFDGSFLKLREIHLSYSFPKKLLAKTGFIRSADLSFIASNVAILWLHSSNKAKIDPESSTNSGNSGVGLESSSFPPTRSMGFKLSVTF